MNLHLGAHVLVAGIGNIDYGDDAFGVAVARRLAAKPLPPGVRVLDIGIRNLRLAHELVDGGYPTLILIDVVRREVRPGTIHVVRLAPRSAHVGFDPLAGRSEQIIALVDLLGGRLEQTVIVGCEPARIEEGAALSRPVAAAVGAAADTVLRLAIEATEPAAVAAVRQSGRLEPASVAAVR